MHGLMAPVVAGDQSALPPAGGARLTAHVRVSAVMPPGGRQLGCLLRLDVRQVRFRVMSVRVLSGRQLADQFGVLVELGEHLGQAAELGVKLGALQRRLTKRSGASGARLCDMLGRDGVLVAAWARPAPDGFALLFLGRPGVLHHLVAEEFSDPGGALGCDLVPVARAAVLLHLQLVG